MEVTSSLFMFTEALRTKIVQQDVYFLLKGYQSFKENQKMTFAHLSEDVSIRNVLFLHLILLIEVHFLLAS